MDRALDLVQLRLEESKVSLLGLPTETASWADEGRHPSTDMWQCYYLHSVIHFHLDFVYNFQHNT